MVKPLPAASATPYNFALQSTPKHIALIMDGNRRWARTRNLPASEGHKAGLQQLFQLLPSLASSPVRTVTVFAFSSANWQRQSSEVTHLFHLAELALKRFTPLCLKNGIRVRLIGRQDRLPTPLQHAAHRAARLTANGERELLIAVDYSSRHCIREAAKRLSERADADDFESLLDGCGASAGPIPDVDLLIRTGKEQRLSDFLLWESAFAELYFPDLYWPDFTPAELNKAMDWYSRRQRRYGA